MANNSTYRLANAIFAWEKEITVPIIVTDGSADFKGHYVTVPIAEISREFCLAFADADAELDALKQVELGKISSLVFPLENISIVPLFGFQKSREIANVTGDLTLFSFVRLSRHPRHSAELAPFWPDIIYLGLRWLINSNPLDYLKYVECCDNGMGSYLRNSYVEDYLRLWVRLMESPVSKAELKKYAKDKGNFDFEKFDQLTDYERVDVLDDWLNVCSVPTRALLRFRNGLTPNFRNRCTQELVGRFLVLSQAAISHMEREKFGKRCYTFSRYLQGRFKCESS